ncbi:MAG: FHA domain-containing protein [Deltaproteobacteria bacterium]|nr:FHA domain-containing protein [Deltaproteobacteria bacterium]
MNKIILIFNGRIVDELTFKGKEMTIGRGVGNDLRIDNPAVSSKHARIVREKDCFVLEDLGSSNGTLLNGKKITRSIVNSTDNIIVGKHQLKVGWEHGTGGFDEPVDTGSRAVIDSLDKTMMIDQSTAKKGGGSTKGATGGFALMEGGVVKEQIDMRERVTTIGKSSDAGIKIKGLLAPKVAALVNRSDKGYVITSPDSKKPPLINGKPLGKPYILKKGDQVEVGGLTLRFYLRK